MIRRCWLLVTSLAWLISPVSASGVPQEVAARFEQAISFDQSDGFVGSYRITLSSVIQKPNGKSRKENLIEADVVINGDGSRLRQLVKFLEDGSDVTEKKRKSFEGEDGGRRDEDDDLIDPFGGTADHYRFSEPERRGAALVVAFAPARGHEKDDNIAHGEIAWDPSNSDPLWLVMTAVDPPSPLQRLEFRMEYTKIGDQHFVSRLVSEGLAKIVLIKRQFHMEIRFDDIRLQEKVEGTQSD